MTARSAFEARCFRLADEALATGLIAVDGDLVAVPDVMLAEGLANRDDVPPGPTLRRADGRTVAFFRGPPGDAA